MKPSCSIFIFCYPGNHTRSCFSLMIRKAGSANNRQQRSTISLCVCTRVEFCSFSFLAIEPSGRVVAREVEKHAARMPYIGGAEAPATDGPMQSDQNPYRSHAGGHISRTSMVRRDAFAGACLFLIQFFAGCRRRRASPAGARTDYTKRPCEKFKDTKGSCQSERQRMQQLMEQTRCCFPICLSDLRLVPRVDIDHVKLD
jgi:hypothetical protein